MRAASRQPSARLGPGLTPAVCLEPQQELRLLLHALRELRHSRQLLVVRAAQADLETAEIVEEVVWDLGHNSRSLATSFTATIEALQTPWGYQSDD